MNGFKIVLIRVPNDLWTGMYEHFLQFSLRPMHKQWKKNIIRDVS